MLERSLHAAPCGLEMINMINPASFVLRFLGDPEIRVHPHKLSHHDSSYSMTLIPVLSVVSGVGGSSSQR